MEKCLWPFLGSLGQFCLIDLSWGQGRGVLYSENQINPYKEFLVKLLKLVILSIVAMVALNACASKKEPATIIDTESQECGQSKEGCSDY